jgi:hypothetical protein
MTLVKARAARAGRPLIQLGAMPSSSVAAVNIASCPACGRSARRPSSTPEPGASGRERERRCHPRTTLPPPSGAAAARPVPSGAESVTHPSSVNAPPPAFRRVPAVPSSGMRSPHTLPGCEPFALVSIDLVLFQPVAQGLKAVTPSALAILELGCISSGERSKRITLWKTPLGMVIWFSASFLLFVNLRRQASSSPPNPSRPTCNASATLRC